MRTFVYKTFSYSSVALVIGYLFSCLTPYVSPVDFWPLTYLDLGFPFLAGALVIFIVCWFFIKKINAVLLLVVLLLGYKNLNASIGLNLFQSDKKTNRPFIRLMTWNVKGFDNPAIYLESPTALRRRMFNYIKEQNATILCLQEFTEHDGPGMFSNTQELIKLGYKYYYRTDDVSRLYPYGTIIGCSAIFSKIPITKFGKTVLGDSSFPEHIGFADVLMENKPIRIFTAHFKSYNFHAYFQDSIDIVPFHNDMAFVYKASAFEKIKVFTQDHAKQAAIAKNQLNNTKIPYVFGGDLNAVPASYAYHLLSAGLQDAFLEKGKGLGATMDSMPITLRIDYLLLHNAISINSYRKDTVRLSDHFPQLIDISWKK